MYPKKLGMDILFSSEIERTIKFGALPIYVNAPIKTAPDEIAKRISYDEFAQAEAIARLWEGASPREEAFKSVGLSKERMDKLFKAQAASELECF